MGRSKFPGKPPKTVTRKRIKVLGRPDTAQTSDSVTVAENIYYGLSLANETLGDNEKEPPPFHGFSSKEAKLSVSYIKTKHGDKKVEQNSKNIKLDPQNHAQQSENNTVEADENSSSKVVTENNEKSPGEDEDEEVKNKSNTKPKVCKRVRFKTVAGTPVLKSVNNILDRHQRTRQLRNSTAKRLLQRAKFNSNTNNRGNGAPASDKTSSVRKFILPMRSAHSSRVIKPNKRFIEELEERTSPDNENDSKNTKKVKVMSEQISNTENIEKTRNEGKQTRHKWRKNTANIEIVREAQTQKERKTQNSNKIKNTSNRTTHDSKQLCVPVKALPDSNAPIVESSRVQTRSGALSEISTVQGCSESSEMSNVSAEESNRNGEKMEVEECEQVEEENADEFDSDSELSDSGTDQSNHSEDEQSEWTGMKLDGGKVILRKARLKLDNKNSGGTEGPFSVTNPQNLPANQTNPGLTGTVKCGVCGAVRFYRFVKQARKFGIHSCESCRKFISKMIKRQACATAGKNSLPILQCHKGDGLCLVPPVVRSQQWNLMRCVYKARCPACWLKMCLKCYHIPTTLKAGLNALLPPLMRDPVISLGSLGQDDSDVLGQKTIGSLSWPSEDSLEKNLFKSAMSWSGIEISKEGISNGASSKKSGKFDSLTSVSPGKKRKKDNRIKVRKKVKNPVVSPPPTPAVTQGAQAPVVRQRVDLKGPRVKHVCRSASVALGQPIATFPTGDGKDETDANKTVLKTSKDEDKSDKREEITKESQKTNQENNGNSNNNVQQPYTKRNKNQQNILAPNHQVVRALPKPTVNTVHTISIDFWEQYDPAEVGAKGFALIGSENFHIPAICFLCGSAGKEPLIHCQCCCEPYHAFCLEPSEWNACAQPNWCCPRCTICQTCHLRVGPKLSCIRCRQSFHHACLSKSGVNARLYSPDTPYVCQSCVKCKSCGSEGVNVYVGNLPLCSMCFKLRQRGNYCPLCQRCYNENDFDSKMMECNECSCWVHARCERLSDEFYQVLSYLPDSIEFTCSQCSPNPNSVWRSAIECELKAGFISVIKALSKNRKMCAALKWSPRKECLCKPIASVRRLDFSDERFSRELAEEPEDVEKPPESVVDSKVDPLSRFDFEIDDQPIDLPRRGLRRLKQKFHLKECSVRVKNCIPKDTQEDSSSQESSSTCESRECHCSEQQILVRPSPTLMSVKRKVNGNEYRSLFQFHCDMEHVVNRAGADDLMESYHKSLQEVFPWFDPKRSKISCSGNGLSTPSKDPSKCLDSPICSKLDDSILETWKEEVLKAPKAIAAKTGNLYSNIIIEDTRYCSLCKGLGDGQGTREGRLLYCGQNEWVHSNCALWSNEVFEEIDGSLQNVHSAISRGRQIRCSECGKKGASVGCCAKNCSTTYHFPCARNVGLGFNEDKTIFCASHLSNCATKTPHNNDDFELKRLVYVELDRKKKKFVEPSQVKVMIGSLMIDCLGTIVPEFSDTIDKILPTNYKCSRLYWSTVNPMKIVKYYIRTYVQHCTAEVTLDAEHNVTIDHSNELEREERQKLEQLVVKQTLDAVIDSVYNREVDENLAEQNNTDLLPPEITDVIFEDLPHDLLDGISMQDIFPKMSYEDFLAMDMRGDGVFGNDLLKDDILSSDVDEMIKPSDNKASKVDPAMLELSQNDLWLHLETKGCVQELVDDLLSSKGQKMGGRELKRSKSEVIGNNPLMVGGQRHHQRSCSLTWSCKLDGTYGPTMKRRKIPRQAPSPRTTGEANVMMMDPQNERTSMFHELRIPESIMLTVGRATTPSIIGENNKDHKRLLWHTRQQQQPRIVQVDGPADPSSASECSSPEYNIEERIPQIDGTNDETSSDSSSWFSFRDNTTSPPAKQSPKDSRHDKSAVLHYENSNESFKIPQLDGADDISSDDESSQNAQPAPVPCSTPITNIGNGPVTCKRCQCTYRTQDSYNRHLITCDIVTTSDSDSETIDNKGASPNSRFSDSVGSMSPQFITMSPSAGHTLSSEYPDMQVTSPLEASVPSPHPTIQIEPIAQALITPQIHTHSTVETVHQTVLTSNDVIVQTQYTRTTTTLPNSAVLPQESTVQITEITDTPTSSEGTLTPNLSPTGIIETIASPQVSPIGPSMRSSACGIVEGAQMTLQSPKISKPKSPRTPKTRTKLIKPQTMRNSVPQQVGPVRYQTMQSTAPVLQLQQQTQRPTAPTVILQQVPGSGLMSYVETLQQQSGQNLQYITAIGGQEANYKPQYITTNQLVPGAYIQAGSDNLLALQNGGISVLPGVQLAQPQQTVLGTIIQQQPNTIQCGVISSEQLVLSSAPTLEMFTDSTGSMFVSSQPMYYGLETIVSNTVMSSSQFMAGAVPQVLASSYQTTTQVFQASKLMEPLVDVQTVPNVSNVAGVQTVQSIPGVSNLPGGYVVVNPTNPESIPTPQISVSSSLPPTLHHQTSSFIRPTCNSHCNPTPVMESARPVPAPDVRTIQQAPFIPQTRAMSPPRPIQQALSTIPRVAVRPSPVAHTVTQSNHSQWKIPEPLYATEQTITNSTRPYLDSKHVSENTSMIKSSISSKLPPLSNHCITQRDIHMNRLNLDVNSLHNIYNSGITNNDSAINSMISNYGVKSSTQTTVAPPTRPMNRVLPMQAVAPKQEIVKPVQKPEIVIEEPTKPVIKSTVGEVTLEPIKTVDCDAVEKIVFTLEKSFMAEKALEEACHEADIFSEKSVVMSDEKVVEKSVEILVEEQEIVDIKEIEVVKSNEEQVIKLKSDEIDESKENLKVDIDKDKLNNASLKIVLQKQLQDGSYKITHNMKPTSESRGTPKITSVEILPSKQTPQIASLQLLPIKSFTLKTNKIEEKSKLISMDSKLPEPKVPPVAVKKPRLMAKNTISSKTDPPIANALKKTGPSLMYEIKSQDGFTHTASSMAEVWETVFQAVQTARKAHNLPPLAHNPLTEDLGLDNNATVYLVEQLAGVNRCTKYKPRFHNLSPPKTLYNEVLAESDSGAARAEPFKSRKVHDMFSWLASRHRQQPKMIAISENEMRKAASTNLPMAMRFRILKETSKESVGVYHSHIHGRGLFCLRDIEAGEMVIEYAGEVIRASLTDKREKYYDTKHIGCYMFKIDDHLVVDATMKGNAARFINHSCEPNCYSRVVDILGKKHILIFALRRIVQGEELTYDYKFPFEDIKIPCTCGSRRCRKYLN